MQRQASTQFTIPTRVVLVDDHPLIREGLAKLFDEIRGVVGHRSPVAIQRDRHPAT